MEEFPVKENQKSPIDELLFELLYSANIRNGEFMVKSELVGKSGWSVQILQEPDYYVVNFMYNEKESPVIKYYIKYHAIGDYNNTVYQAGRILEILNGEPV